MGKAFVDRLADYHFALPGREPATLDQLHLRTQFEAIRHHAADRDVDFSRTILAREHNHYYPLACRHRFAVAVLGDSRQVLHYGGVGSIKTARELSLRPFAQHEHVLRIASGARG